MPRRMNLRDLYNVPIKSPIEGQQALHLNGATILLYLIVGLPIPASMSG